MQAEPSVSTHAMTIDVEDYFQVGVFQDQVALADWDSFECRVERNLDHCLELLDAQGVKATFFVLGWIADRFPQAIKQLVDEGHEVGSHGYNHQPIWKLSPQEFSEDIKRSQAALAQVIGKLPNSYRAPCFSVTSKTLWALEILAAEGIQFDSSIFPVNHPEYGIPGAEAHIHKAILKSGAELLEFPMTTGQFFGKRLAFCGGGYFRLFPYGLTRKKLKEAAKNGHPFIFYLHPWELDPDQPSLKDKTGMTGRFRHYVNLKRNPKKFAALLADFRFSTMESVLSSYPKGELKTVQYDTGQG